VATRSQKVEKRLKGKTQKRETQNKQVAWMVLMNVTRIKPRDFRESSIMEGRIKQETKKFIGI